MFMTELIHEFLFDCKVRELSPRTIHEYEKQLGQFRRFIRESCEVQQYEELKPVHIKMFISALQDRGCAPSYINDMLKAVKVLCGYAFREGYSEDMLTKRINNVKEPKVLIHTFNTKEISLMVKYYSGSNYISMRNKLIIMVFFDTGIRLSELINMKLEDIQSNHFVIYGKGRKERVVPKNAAVSKQLMKYLRVREEYFIGKKHYEEEYVFLSKNGYRLTSEAVSVILKEAGGAVGVRSQVRVSPHTCRHTFAQQQIANGLDLYTLSRILGHESVSITQRYLESMMDSQIISKAIKTSVLANL